MPCGCDASERRVTRRVQDRLFSLLVPVRRYRCGTHTRQWEGLLRAPRGEAARVDGRDHRRHCLWVVFKRVAPSMCHTATNSAAMAGPSTQPLMPNTAMPPFEKRVLKQRPVFALSSGSSWVKPVLFASEQTPRVVRL